jgi:outer membrane protein OmpA-like peptidoglycan-associated protein
MVAVVLASSVVLISPSSATGQTIAITTTAYSPGNAANVGVSLSGFDQTQSYQATIKFVNTHTNEDVTNGTLAATQGSTSLISGYTSYSAAKLGFRGTYAAISAALSSMTWNPATSSGNISIRIGIASVPGTNEYYDANSSRYYRFVPATSALSWTSARDAAEAMILFGQRGYLAEINSQAENSFIGTETSATNIWIGASDRAVEGTWIWDGATSTYNKPAGSGGSAQGAGGAFSSWASGEPNDHVSGGVDREDCAVTNWSGAVGRWNDLPCASAYAYLVEFGGRPGETSTAATATLTTTVTAVDPTVISVHPIGGVTVPATGGTPASTVTAANGYTGTVTWSPSGSPFAASTAYTATITLTAASSFTLTGVTANFFTVSGASSVTHNANSGIITAVFPATAIAPPAFSISREFETATAGSAISGYTITSTGGTIASYSISPAISNSPGLSFDAATGLISGTPTTSASSRAYTITATNATSSVSRTYSITVNLAPPTFTLSNNEVEAMQGSPITSYSISSSGGPIDTFSISPSIADVAGLTFNSSTGLISGTPRASIGPQTYTITGSNAVGSTSRSFKLTINSPPPPSTLKTIAPPRITQDSSSYFCLAGTFIFVRNGYTEETPKITSQKYFLVQDGKIVESVASLLGKVSFEKKSGYLNTTLSCTVEVFQESIQSTVSSLNTKLFSEANEKRRSDLKQADVQYFKDRATTYADKDKEFSRIEEIRQKEIAAAKTASAILLASSRYQKAFSATSDLWKSALQNATIDRANSRALAETNYLELLEKSGVSIRPRTAVAVIAPIPTPSVSPTPTPKPPATQSTNPQPTSQMAKVGTVFMASGSYFLNDATKITLRALALKINASRAKSILVYGHTDNRGGVNNTVLSQNRARAVANFLRPLVNTKKISVGWFASKKPVAGGNSAAALAQNRRVEIYTR